MLHLQITSRLVLFFNFFFYLIELLVLSSFTIFGHRCVGGAGGGGAQAGGSHLRLTAAVQK